MKDMQKPERILWMCCIRIFIPYQKWSRLYRQSQPFCGNFPAFCKSQDPEDWFHEHDTNILSWNHHLFRKSIRLDSLLEWHWSPSLPLLPLPRLPGSRGLELLRVCLDPSLEVVQPPLLLLAEHAVGLHHLHVLRVDQLPVIFIRAEVLVRMKLLKSFLTRVSRK